MFSIVKCCVQAVVCFNQSLPVGPLFLYWPRCTANLQDKVVSKVLIGLTKSCHFVRSKYEGIIQISEFHLASASGAMYFYTNLYP